VKFPQPLYRFGETLLRHPRWYHYPLLLPLLPISLLYCTIATGKFPKKYRKFPVPIIGVGNIVVGGSGKTPVVKEIAEKLAEKYRVAVVSRGYGRRSRGVKVVSRWGEVVATPEEGGDEPVEIGLSTPALVIVAEEREKGIEEAISHGAEVVILDDAFHKPIEKLEILIDTPLKNPFCLPAGGYRLPRSFLQKGDIILKEGVNFWRKTLPTSGEVLITSIANPTRLLPFVKVDEVVTFPDHHLFTPKDVEKYRHRQVVTTMKDFPKLQPLLPNLKVIPLQITLSPPVWSRIWEYVEGKG
jgi:tetraacyldisaccharide 4'-kinase